MTTYRQNDDGSWTPAEPMGWREEHNYWQRLVLWALRRPHCQHVIPARNDATRWEA